ncbi:MAG: hypothetical protein ABSA10_04670, partial [Anaerolineales bacterium]
MPEFRFFKRKKRRKFPVKLDSGGRSARSWCFELFAEKAPNQEIAKIVDLPIDTVRRYHLQWNDDPKFERKYIYAKSLFHKTNPDRKNNLEMFTSAWGYSKERLESILSQSHGLRRLMARKILSPAHAEADHKRHLALELALLISDHLTKHGGKYEDVFYSFRRWMQENMKYREDEDANIKEWNQKMELFHDVLASAVKQEREGRVKPDVFSEEERQAILRQELKSRFKQLQTIYWRKIAGLMVEGQTEEQAREKIYRDLLTS